MNFLLLNNLLGFNMKKGFKNFCTGDVSTSTLNQQQQNYSPSLPTPTPTPTPTLEDMILQLDLEEKRAKLYHHRMSCVNSSDILRSARNALNQYPRFSLDGKDAMYRSSFRNTPSTLPAKVAGERVIWCKPGVVGKLMGLDAMPIPVRFKHGGINSCILRKQNLRRISQRRAGGLERRKLDSNGAAASCSMKPPVATDEVGWPMRRFL